MRSDTALDRIGWHVTGFDISSEGLRLAQEAAARQRLTIEAVNADQRTWDFGAGSWDIVLFVYAAAGPDARAAEGLRKSMKRGGLVVVEGFHKDENADIGIETGALSALFGDGFKILHDEVVEDVPDWGPQQRHKLVRFAAERR